VTTLDRDGVRLFYVDQGEGELALLFVHGWSGDHHHFEPQATHIARDHRAISVDLRGHGASDSPDQVYTIEGFADDLAWMCGRLGADRVVVVGHSMGGSVGLAMAAARPELVSALVLVDSPLVWPDETRSVLREAAEAMSGPDGAVVRRTIIDAFFIPSDDQRRRSSLTDQMLRTPGSVAASSFLSIATWDQDSATALVRAPVLALLSGTMPLTIADHFPAGVVEDLTVGQTVGAGHFIQLEVPDQVNAMIGRYLLLLEAGRDRSPSPSAISEPPGADIVRQLFS
jgi:pimeloyl-ACP methyl ester carboxylesterase